MFAHPLPPSVKTKLPMRPSSAISGSAPSATSSAGTSLPTSSILSSTLGSSRLVLKTSRTNSTSGPSSAAAIPVNKTLPSPSSVPEPSPTSPSCSTSFSSIVGFSSLTRSMSQAKLSRLVTEFLSLCGETAPNVSDLESKLQELRTHILFEGIADEPKTATSASLRGKLWKIMMGVSSVSANEYIEYVQMEKSVKYMKIRGDSFRTFPKDTEFKQVVPEEAVIRVLNSFVNQFSPHFTYCQGMNTICAPFLYCMPEVDAYFTFCRVITKKIPLYWLSSHIGVEAGCKLVDNVLQVVDTELSAHLQSYHLSAYVYAFHCVSSLSASIPPFRELLKLWDFLMAFGPHFNILCVVAQVISLRKDLLESDAPKELLDYRKWPPLNATFTISVAMALLPKIPPKLYEKICQHGVKTTMAQEITGRKVEGTTDM